MKYIVVMETAPRSDKQTFYIAKQREDELYIYETWAKCAYVAEAVNRVIELNLALEKAKV